MAIAIKQIDLSITNPRLSGLANRQYKDKFTSVPNTKLPAEIQQGLAVVYYGLTGEDLDLSGTTVAVSANEGQFQRLYAPKLYANEAGDGCFIRWGENRIDLVATDGKLAPAKLVPGYKAVLKLSQFNPSGRGEDPAIEVKVTPPKGDSKDQDVYVVNLAVSPKDWKAYTAAGFETVLETDAAAFYDLLSGEASASSGTSISGDVYDDKTIIKAVFGENGEQTFPIELTVTGMKSVKTSYGGTYILQCSPTTDLEVRARCPYAAAQFGMWASRFVKSQLSAVPAPVVSEAEPAVLVLPIGRPAFLRFSNFAVEAGGLDLNFE